MSTNFIYHAFGLRGYDYVRQDFIAGNIIMKVQPKDDLICCHLFPRRPTVNVEPQTASTGG
ncbi:hypothetical protein [Pseudodesulfovibrio methanolicus]|uniref:Uncharacterized protein n=1 Tax=Pseudodesulfovibrio methanolicus TaxID=3126690 RepID=A0ABZ2IQ53_9BACT